jgi:hypothetical protein
VRAIHLVVLAGVLAGCGGLGGPSTNAVLRATVEVEYVSMDTTLGFVPGALEYGHQPWFSHPVEFSIWTDDWVQRVSLYDHYETDGSEFVAAQDAVLTEHLLSDEGASGGDIVFDVGLLNAGEHTFSLSIPVHLEPSPAVGDALQPEDRMLTVDFVYDVYWAETPLDEFCARADQVLRANTVRFSPEAFLEAGSGVLTAAQLDSFEKASDYFEAEKRLGHTDPNPFFDLVEEICNVSYTDRWEAFS